MSNIDILTNIIFLILGTFLGTWFAIYIKRPRLRIQGSGGGGGGGIYQSNLTVSNQPGLIGLRIKQTVIFGKLIFGHIEKGITVDRVSTHECYANLIDKKRKKTLDTLWWTTPLKPGGVSHSVTLNSGDTAQLMLFTRDDNQPGKYFLYCPTSETNSTPIIPSNAAGFDKDINFILEIRYSFGRSRFRRELAINREWDGKISWKAGRDRGEF